MAAYNNKLKSFYALTKPGIVYSNIMTGVAGYFFASKFHIDWIKLLSLIVGMALIIGAACVFNNYIDKDIDKKMKRTNKRELVTGAISDKSALIFASCIGIIGFLSLSLTNLLTWMIGLFAIFSYVILYGYAKRKSRFGTLVGTLPGSATLVAGYTTYTNHLDDRALLLFLIMVSWQMAHFYAIAIYRLKDYRAAGIPVWPVKSGIPSTITQMRMYVVLYIACNLALAIVIKSYVYGIVMLAVCAYWCRFVFANPKTKSCEVWAKKVFLNSLIVILCFSAILSVTRLIS
jgi:protoheme IX farnesyltransferase